MEGLLRIESPYLIFAGDAGDALAAKTGQGIVDWRPERCLAQLRLPNCRADHGLPDMTVAEAARRGAKTFVIGTVGPGGMLPEAWLPILVEAVERGMDVASGLHTRLSEFEVLRDAAGRHGRRLIDVRSPTRGFPTGSGRRRPGRRLLTVGTDCAVGKKYTALALERSLRKEGVDADFRATGQTGILIAGAGVAIDAVPADFISGAVEVLTPAAAEDHWDVVEGQGLDLSSLVRGGLSRSVAWRAAGRVRRLSRADAGDDAQRAGAHSLGGGSDRGNDRARASDQPGHPLHRRGGEHGGARRGRRPRDSSRPWAGSWPCP